MVRSFQSKQPRVGHRLLGFADHAAEVSVAERQDFAFLSQSCVQTSETIKWTDGQEYPLYKLEISSASHPFFTGKMKLLDTTGRVQKFNDRYKKTGYSGGAKKDAAPPAAPAAKPAEEKK